MRHLGTSHDQPHLKLMQLILTQCQGEPSIRIGDFETDLGRVRLKPRVHECVQHLPELYCSQPTYSGVTLSPPG